ncbi:hypothetical protein [Glaciibacter superstes]|uniref:hypothetical protein n=1 Tax=Glaciibacter superstes TaxID=501023 RepID=UPI0003B5DED5|nr:hypothetical protein [Glaciibacter superstes]
MGAGTNAAHADDRTPHQVAQERAMGEISDVLLNLEHTQTRAKKALAQVKKSGGHQNVELALADAIEDMARTHKRLMQDTYYAGDSLRLI